MVIRKWIFADQQMVSLMFVQCSNEKKRVVNFCVKEIISNSVNQQSTKLQAFLPSPPKATPRSDYCLLFVFEDDASIYGTSISQPLIIIMMIVLLLCFCAMYEASENDLQLQRVS